MFERYIQLYLGGMSPTVCITRIMLFNTITWLQRSYSWYRLIQSSILTIPLGPGIYSLATIPLWHSLQTFIPSLSFWNQSKCHTFRSHYWASPNMPLKHKNYFELAIFKKPQKGEALETVKVTFLQKTFTFMRQISICKGVPFSVPGREEWL